MVKVPFFEHFSVPAGLVTYPLTFFLCDFVTEVFGSEKAKKMVYHTFGMSLLAYLIIKVALLLPSSNLENQRHCEEVLGLNGIIVMASLSAYVVSQTLDIKLFTWIKKWTGPNFLWMRTNGSTLIAQLIDTAIVHLIHFKLGLGLEMAVILPMMAFAYFYKCSFSLVLTPLFYFFVFLFKKRPSVRSLQSNL